MKLRNYIILFGFILLNHFLATAQEVVPFSTRLAAGSVNVKGDIIFIGNNIINRTADRPTGFDANGIPLNIAALTAQANTPYNVSANNNGQNMEYIDVDADPTTFSSSRANLAIGTSASGTVNTTVQQCKRIVYAGLYWTASYIYDRAVYEIPGPNNDIPATPILTDWNQIKFRIPGGAYIDIIADNAADPVGAEDNIILSPTDQYQGSNIYNRPYVCYRNITTLLQGLADPNGEYWVANQRASKGENGNGNSGGWGMVVIYESPTLPSKYISTFDGFANIRSGDDPVDFPVSGFQTLPVGFPVIAKIGVSALEGDTNLDGDNLRIRANSVGGFTNITNGLNPVDNFFNGTITDNNVNVVNRLPASTNTLGFDLDQIVVPNPGNTIIPNNEIGATFRLTTDRDSYGAYLTSFAVDIIEPNILLTKTVENSAGNPIGGAEVNLCQDLRYVIGFQNVGNDNARSFTLRDILPINVTFNPATDLILPAGVTLASYNATTREVILNIANNLVEINDPRYEIRIRVRVVCSCLELSNACSNLIQNQAFATYSGQINTAIFSDEGSIASFGACNLGVPGSTNTLVDVDNCTYNTTVNFCGADVVLTAAYGYQTHTWTGPGTITPTVTPSNPPVYTIPPYVPPFNQSVVVNTPGTYTVTNGITTSPCRNITQIFNVVDITGGVGLTNPILPYNENLPATVCTAGTSAGQVLPHIYLCGATDSQLLQTNISTATVTWQVLDFATPGCTGGPANLSLSPLCPSTDAALANCWRTLLTAPSYTVNAAGQYRVVLDFGPQCITRTFYFNVYQNLLAPTFTARDIICTTPGQITINNVPATGYEFSLSSPAGVFSNVWQPSNIFNNINTPGIYTVSIRQLGLANGCVFTVPNIQILRRDMTVTATVIQPLCFGERGSILLAANNVQPQYTFTLTQGATLIGTFGPQASNTQNFINLNAGVYTYTVTTTDGCTATGSVTIVNPPQLTVTAAITRPLLSCGAGEITVYPVGGTPGPGTPPLYSYSYTINGLTNNTTNPVIPVPSPGGTYTIVVTDTNNCTATTSITILPTPPPTFNPIVTNIACYGATTGVIDFNVTNPVGTMGFSITGGAPFTTNPVFTNLLAGTYSLVIQYSVGTSPNITTCTLPAQVVTITEPIVPLSAAGGVYQVACGSLAGNGIIRITNPQGGTPPYSYSFDGGINYGPTNQATVAPGTYTIYVRDFNNCVFPMTVTLDQIPAPPTISVATPTFNCTGSATTTVTVTNPSSATIYNYTYSISPPLVPPHNPASNVFTNVPCGTPTISVNYQLVSVPTFSNLLNETFGEGPSAQSPGINPAYCWNNQPYPAGQPCGNNAVAGFPSPPVCGAWTIEDNQYNVTSAINPNNCAWFDYRDHTSNGTNPRGRFLAVNIGSAAGPNGVLYSKQINDVIPNQPVRIELWVANLLRAGVAGADPDFLLELVDASNNVVSSQLVGVIDNLTDGWQFKQLALNPGSNTSLTFNIRSGSILYNGNDAAIDDIRVFQLPLPCIATRDFPLNIPCNLAFAAQIIGHSDVSCAGANDGTITIAAQNFLPAGYQYSWDNGLTWSAPQFVSPQTLTVPASYLGFVLIRYAGVPLIASCSFNLPQVIITPPALVANATFTPVTCLTGSTITASATGGNGGYQYQVTGTVNYPYQSSPIFPNVPPGTYTVTVRDIRNCTDPINAPLVIAAPVLPTATIGSASDLCYNGLPNTASIQVNVVGANGPFLYYLNNNLIAVNAAVIYTFTNLTAGNYTISVVDALGCSVTLAPVTIAPQLIATGNIIKGLDCTVTPNATIQGAINGGTAPYNYTVAFNGNPASGPVSVTGSNFTYSAAAAGSYVFVVTDAIGCTSTFTQVIAGITNPTVVVTPSAPINCAGDLTGSLTIVPAGGTPIAGSVPYIINVVRNTPLPVTNYGTQVTNLPAGNYTVTVTDANSCTATQTVTIVERPPITFTETLIQKQCTPTGTVLGSISTSVITGGTAPYTVTLYSTSAAPIAIATAGATVNFPNLIPDTYTLEVVDANSCRTTHPNLILTDVTGLIINTTQPTPTCATGATIIVTVIAAAGGPYTFGIANGTNVAPYSNSMLPADVGFPFQHTFSNLTANTLYTFVIFDASTNCYTFQTATTGVTPLTNITANIISVNCLAAPGVVNPIQFTIANVTPGTTSVNYQVFIAGTNTPVAGASGSIVLPALISPVITMPFAGNFYVQLTENHPNPVLNGCSSGSGNFSTTNAPILPLSLTVSNNINANCNQLNALVTVQGAGGAGAPYTYAAVPSGNPAPLPAAYSATNPLTLNSTTTLTWVVYVRDAAGCVASIPVTISVDPLPTLTVPPFATNQCTSTGTSYTFTVTGTGLAPLAYAITSPAVAVTPYQSSPTFTVNAPGSYQVSIRDRNGCIASASNGPLVIYPPIAATASFTTQPVCNTATGAITVVASGGSGVANFTYSILPNIGITLAGTVFSNVASGSYTVTVRDNITGCTRDVLVDLGPPTPVTFTLAQTPVVCIGDSNGTITVSLGAGNNDFNYSYAIISPFVTANQSSPVFTGLAAGLYTIQVTSGRGCTDTETITVGQPTPIVIQPPTITAFACAPGTNITNLASITVSGVTGGSGTYNTYQFLNSLGAVLQTSTSNVFQTSVTTGGTYTINVFDSTGCIGTTTATILPFVSISAPVVTVTSPITCIAGENIQVSVTASGVVGLLPLTYSIVSIPPGFSATNTTGLFTGLAIGDYEITITNPNTGCSVEIIHYVFDPNTFALTATAVANVQCFGASNGSVSLTFIDNVLPNNAGVFSYTITNTAGVVASGTSGVAGAGPFVVPTGLAAGLYTVSATLTNSPSCTVVTNFTIIGPDSPLTVTISSTPVTCVTGNNDGTITAIASGGWLTAPYQYQLVGPINVAFSGNNIFTGLIPGSYTVNVRDGNGCIVASTPVVLSIPTAIAATVTSLPILCNNGTTSITISNVTGGQGSNYFYTIKGPVLSNISGPQPLPASGTVTVGGQVAGNYEVEITDGWSCSNVFPLTITQPALVLASLTTSVGPTCISGASLVLTGTGGTPPYSYSSTGVVGTFTTPFASNTTIGPLSAGTYSYYIQDANGCISLVSNDIVVPVVVPTSIASLTSENILCGGSNTGKITVIAQNGQGGYIYTLYNCAGAAVAGATQLQPGVFTNLSAGCYFVRVTGTGGCTVDSPQVVITEPTPFQITYTVNPVTCFAGSNGSIRVQTSGGTGIVQYVLTPLSAATVTPPTPTDFTISDLPAGNYVISVFDQNGCFGLNPPPSPYLFTITQPATPVAGLILAASVIDETCLGDNDGAFTVSGITGGTGPNYFISLSLSNGTPIVVPSVPINNLPSVGSHTFTNLAGGNYIVTITDSSITGCPRELDQAIQAGVDVNPFANVTFPCVNNVPAVRVEAENLQNPPSLSFDPAADFMFTLTRVGGVTSALQLSPIFTSDVHPILLTPGQYFITAMNSNGCDRVTQTFDILASDLDVLTLTLSQGGLNEIVAISTGGSGGNTYTFNGDNNGSDNTYIYDATGNYTVRVTDSSGCFREVTQPFVFIPICIPDFFTPNGDGTNSTWTPGCTQNYPNLKTFIYDRYGRKVKELKEGETWDGKYEGKELPSGDYWYVIKVNGDKNESEYVGHFTLYR